MKLQILSTIVAMSMAGASATAVDCGTVQTIYQNSQCCSDTGAETCAHKLEVASSDTYLVLDDTTGILKTTQALDDKLETIETPRLANSAVTDVKLADNAVTTAKLANNAVTADKLAGYLDDGNSIRITTATEEKPAKNTIFENHVQLNTGLYVAQGVTMAGGKITGTAGGNGLTVEDGVTRSTSRFDVLHAGTDMNDFMVRVQDRKGLTSQTTHPEVFINARTQFSGYTDFRGNVDVYKLMIYPNGGDWYEFASGESTVTRGMQMWQHNGAHRIDFPGIEYLRVETGIILAENVQAPSDRRIKKDIVDIPDALALETFRGLEAKYYYYENNDKSDVRQIGFIAQEVREAIPEAAALGRGTLPDEQRVVEVLWQEVVDSAEYSMELSLETLAPGKYKFKFPGDGSMAELETLDGKTFLTGDGKVWTSKTKHSEVELFGSIVDDFHYINKDKIFTVAYAALQEVDRTQQALLLTIASLEARLAALEA